MKMVQAALPFYAKIRVTNNVPRIPINIMIVNASALDGAKNVSNVQLVSQLNFLFFINKLIINYFLNIFY